MKSGIADLGADYKIYNENKKIYNYNAVRSVINLNKCVLDGGCYEVEEKYEVDCNNLNNGDDKKVIEVDNTIKVVSKIILIISVLLIFDGILVFVYNYLKSKMNRNSL